MPGETQNKSEFEVVMDVRNKGSSEKIAAALSKHSIENQHPFDFTHMEILNLKWKMVFKKY